MKYITLCRNSLVTFVLWIVSCVVALGMEIWDKENDSEHKNQQLLSGEVSDLSSSLTQDPSQNVPKTPRKNKRSDKRFSKGRPGDRKNNQTAVQIDFEQPVKECEDDDVFQLKTLQNQKEIGGDNQTRKPAVRRGKSYNDLPNQSTVRKNIDKRRSHGQPGRINRDQSHFADTEHSILIRKENGPSNNPTTPRGTLNYSQEYNPLQAALDKDDESTDGVSIEVRQTLYIPDAKKKLEKSSLPEDSLGHEDSSVKLEGDSEHHVDVNTDAEKSLNVLGFNAKRGDAHFIEGLDSSFFATPPAWIAGSGFLTALMFAMPSPTAMTAVVMNVTGNFLSIPVGEWLSSTMVGWLMTSLTFAALKEGCETGLAFGYAFRQKIISCCLKKQSKEENVLFVQLMEKYSKYSWKIGYKRSYIDYLSNGFGFISGLHGGLLPAALLSLVWSNYYSHMIIPFGALLIIYHGAQDYNSTVRTVRYVLRGNKDQQPVGEFIYESHIGYDNIELEKSFNEMNVKNSLRSKRNKEELLRGIQQSLVEIEEHDQLANDKYALIKSERDKVKGTSLDAKEYFAISALISNGEFTLESDRDDDQSSRSYCCGTGRVCHMIQGVNNKFWLLMRKPTLVMEMALESTSIIGCGIATKYAFGIFWNYLLPGSQAIPMLVDASTGTVCTIYGLKGLLNIAREAKQYHETHAAHYNRVSNFTIAGVGALLPAGLSALIGVSLGLQGMDASGTSSDWKYLMIPFGLREFGHRYSRLKSDLYDFGINAVTAVPEYVKDRIVDYTPQRVADVVSTGCGFFSRCSTIFDYLPSCFTRWPSTCFKRCWLRKWHRDLSDNVEHKYDTVTNASLYFRTLEHLGGYDHPMNQCDDSNDESLVDLQYSIVSSDSFIEDSDDNA